MGTDSRKQVVGTAATLPQLPLGLGELGECFSDPYCQLGPPLAQPGYQGPHPNSGTSLSSYWLPPASGIHTGSPDLLGWVFSKGVGVVGGVLIPGALEVSRSEGGAVASAPASPSLCPPLFTGGR